MQNTEESSILLINKCQTEKKKYCRIPLTENLKPGKTDL